MPRFAVYLFNFQRAKQQVRSKAAQPARRVLKNSWQPKSALLTGVSIGPNTRGVDFSDYQGAHGRNAWCDFHLKCQEICARFLEMFLSLDTWVISCASGGQFAIDFWLAGSLSCRLFASLGQTCDQVRAANDVDRRVTVVKVTGHAQHGITQRNQLPQ